MSIESYCPKLPLDISEDSSLVMVRDSLANVKQKLRMIVLTNPGEKLMDPEFGLGIKRYLFEPTSGIIGKSSINNSLIATNLRSAVLQNLKNQVYKYSPDIVINDLMVEYEEHIVKMTIKYSYLEYTTDTLTLELIG